MNELRRVLEHAFAELFQRLERIDASSAAAGQRAGEALALAQQHAEADLNVADALSSIGSLAVQAVDRLDVVTERLVSIQQAVDVVRAQSELGPPPVDLAPLDRRLGRLVKGIGARMAEDRDRVEAVLAGMAEELKKVADRPVAVDTAAFEDAAIRGSLHNAADIANLRNDVETLTEAVRVQEKGIGDLRTTLEWIRERLLLR